MVTVAPRGWGGGQGLRAESPECVGEVGGLREAGFLGLLVRTNNRL